ncbi:nucleophosmin-like [Clavelina lepadiformis]|uniref:Nucleophosmin n=1 Tax=Clavelina lepadiformis TaxID=159417 RepID=A0ABP0F7X1_CLALP
MDFETDMSKEYLWCIKLDKAEKSNHWEGRDDGGLEQLVLKRACMGVGAKDGERQLLEVTSFNSRQERVEACFCSLRGGSQEDVNLSDLTIFPPAIFKLIEGNGPVHLVGNHMMMGDEDDSEDEDYSDDEVSLDLDDDVSDEVEEEKPKIKENGDAGKKQVKSGKVKKQKIKEEIMDDEDEDEDDEDDVDLEEEDEDEEETPVPAPQPKKRKLETKAGDENKKPDTTTPQKKKRTIDAGTPKTPLQQKENKTPQSGKKTPAKAYGSVDEVKAAIKKYPGGKPKKEDKFCNWVKSAFKVSNDEWIKDLWKAHKKDLGL